MGGNSQGRRVSRQQEPGRGRVGDVGRILLRRIARSGVVVDEIIDGERSVECLMTIGRPWKSSIRRMRARIWRLRWNCLILRWRCMPPRISFTPKGAHMLGRMRFMMAFLRG